MMATYLKPIWKALRLDQRLLFFRMSDAKEFRPGEEARIAQVLPVPSFNRVLAPFFSWDMVIVSCHGFHEVADSRRCPVIHVPHGPGDGTFGDTKNSHCYGSCCYDVKGRLRYTRMFEGSERKKALVARSLPDIGAIIQVVGNPKYDELLSKVARREEIRKDLGFSPDDTVVFVTSTFREPSLLEAYGDEILAAAKPLIGRFQFVISGHPSLYNVGYQGKHNWPEFLPNLRGQGFCVRDPEEDFAPYMIAANLLMTDHTGLCVYGALLEKPAIFTVIEDKYILKDSPTWRYRAISPVLTDVTSLEPTILSAIRDYPYDRLRELAHDIHPYTGQSENRIRAAVYGLLNLPPAERPEEDKE
jgi:hypothetical protein